MEEQEGKPFFMAFASRLISVIIIGVFLWQGYVKHSAVEILIAVICITCLLYGEVM